MSITDPEQQAKALAVEISDELRAPPELTERILNDLNAIYATKPRLQGFGHQPDRIPNEIKQG